MIKRRKKTLALLVISSVMILLIYQLLLKVNITETNDFFDTTPTVEEQILEYLVELNPKYYQKTASVQNYQSIINNIVGLGANGSVKSADKSTETKNMQYHKKDLFSDKQVMQIIDQLKHSQIVHADLDKRGTQLKLLLTLKSGQMVIFKPKWYDLDHTINGPVYAGKDRFQSEVLAFYLATLMKKPLVPVAAQRKINVNHLKSVASKQLLSTSYKRGNSTCIFGKCHYCKKEDPICDVNGSLEGAVILNINATIKTYRSPWQRTYSSAKKALWQTNEDYCRIISEKMDKQRLYELVETSIFDFLIQNGDRHHYETINNRIVWMDNGKGLGNAAAYHIDILAPLYQCCLIHQDFLTNLKSLSGGLLSELLKQFQEVKTLINEKHLKAIDDRLLVVFATVEYCKAKTKSKLKK